MSLKSKIDFAVIVAVKNANPNGDPLNGNRPRVTADEIGEISDVCIKRKIRDRLAEQGHSILIQSNDRKTDECKSIRSRVDQAELPKDEKAQKEEACKKWIDVRTFGQLFAFKSTKKKKKVAEEEDEGSDSVSIGIRGPVSIHPAFSVEPVRIMDTQITKSVNSEDGEKKGSDTMGMKYRIDQGIYVFYGSMSPQLAHTTGFSDADAEVIKAVLPRLFENDASSARPDGSMRVLKVIWWKHSSPHGQYSSARVHGSLKVNNTENDLYEILPLAGLQPEEIDGF